MTLWPDDPDWMRKHRPMRWFFRQESAWRRRFRRAIAEHQAFEDERRARASATVYHRPPQVPRSVTMKGARVRTKKYARPPEPTAAISAERFDRIFKAQGGRCFLCSDPFTDDDWATIEHVKPKALGGGIPANICLAHLFCNNLKGDRPPLPCELIYLDAVNATLPPAFLRSNIRKAPPPFVPLRQRLAAV